MLLSLLGGTKQDPRSDQSPRLLATKGQGQGPKEGLQQQRRWQTPSFPGRQDRSIQLQGVRAERTLEVGVSKEI